MGDLVGKYRNRQGVEMEITGLHLDTNILGTIYEGVVRDELFGPHYMLVTPDGLTDCGYERIRDDA